MQRKIELPNRQSFLTLEKCTFPKKSPEAFSKIVFHLPHVAGTHSFDFQLMRFLNRNGAGRYYIV